MAPLDPDEPRWTIDPEDLSDLEEGRYVARYPLCEARGCTHEAKHDRADGAIVCAIHWLAPGAVR